MGHYVFILCVVIRAVISCCKWTQVAGIPLHALSYDKMLSVFKPWVFSASLKKICTVLHRLVLSLQCFQTSGVILSFNISGPVFTQPSKCCPSSLCIYEKKASNKTRYELQEMAVFFFSNWRLGMLLLIATAGNRMPCAVFDCILKISMLWTCMPHLYSVACDGYSSIIKCY